MKSRAGSVQASVVPVAHADVSRADVEPAESCTKVCVTSSDHVQRARERERGRQANRQDEEKDCRAKENQNVACFM